MGLMSRDVVIQAVYPTRIAPAPDYLSPLRYFGQLEETVKHNGVEHLHNSVAPPDRTGM